MTSHKPLTPRDVRLKKSTSPSKDNVARQSKPDKGYSPRDPAKTQPSERSSRQLTMRNNVSTPVLPSDTYGQVSPRKSSIPQRAFSSSRWANARLHKYVNTKSYTKMRACMRMHVFVYAYMYACNHVCTYACMFVHVDIRTYGGTHVRTHVQSYMHTCMHAYIHACMHTCAYIT